MSEDRALERRVKRHVYGSPHLGELRHPPGFQALAQAEAAGALASLLSPGRAGAASVAVRGRRLLVEGGGLPALTELTLRLLTAWDVRLEIGAGRVAGPDQVLGLVDRAPLDLYWPAGREFVVRLDVAGGPVPHERALRERIEALLAGRGYRVWAGAPAGGADDGPDEGPAVTDGQEAPPGPETLRVEVAGRRCSLSLSLPGEPLYRRGYRAVLGGGAPLREDIAAAIVRTLLGHARETIDRLGGRWADPDCVLLPFSGTGTLGTELLLVSRGLAAGLTGRRHAFEGWVCHRPRATAWLRGKLGERGRESLAGAPPLRVLAFDRDEEAAAACGANLERLGALAGRATGLAPESFLQATSEVGDFWELDLGAMVPEGAAHVVLPLNPPFGRRLAGSLDVPRFYHGIGRRVADLTAALAGRGTLLSGALLCPDEETWRAFLAALPAGLVRHTVHFTLGGQDMRLCAFCGS